MVIYHLIYQLSHSFSLVVMIPLMARQERVYKVSLMNYVFGIQTLVRRKFAILRAVKA